MRTSSLLALALPLAILASGSGCGRQPQVAAENRELLVSLATAVSAREPDWLERNDRLIEQQRQAGQMTEAEYKAFRSIIDRARSGDWPGAETDVHVLRDGQQPTVEDRSKSTERRLGDHHGMTLPRAGKRR